VLQRVTVSCSELQCVACVAACCSGVVWCFAAMASVADAHALQCVVVCCC